MMVGGELEEDCRRIVEGLGEDLRRSGGIGRVLEEGWQFQPINCTILDISSPGMTMAGTTCAIPGWEPNVT